MKPAPRFVPRRERSLSLWLSLPLAAAALFGSAGARAQTPSPTEEARAQALYEEGTKLLDAGDVKQACPRLEEAVRLVPDASGAHLALGVCFERSGRLASALVHFEKAASFAGAFPERKQRAEASAEGIRSRVPRLAVEISAGAPASATLRVDGRLFARGAPMLLDAGGHVVELVEGERTIAREAVVLSDGAVTRLALGPTSASVLPPTGTDPASGSGAPFGAKGRDGDRGRGGPPFGVLGAVAIGVGGAGLILGSVAGAVAAGRDAASDEACDERDFCNEEGFAARDEAFTWATVSTVGLIVGGALATTGIVLVVVDGSAAEPTAATRPAPPRAAVGVGPTGLLVRGSF